MNAATRARCDRGHFLPAGEEPYTLDPEGWDDTCHCKPRPVEAPPTVEDFGHRPVIGSVDGRSLTQVCARCTTVKRGPGIWWLADVRWPCTSAVVLGLAPRSLAP